eukprot:9306132-Heterocapsa_arctica.AAC.2
MSGTRRRPRRGSGRPTSVTQLTTPYGRSTRRGGIATSTTPPPQHGPRNVAELGRRTGALYCAFPPSSGGAPRRSS